MIIVTPTFNFNGCCAEAISLYEKAFGATTKFFMRYSEADERDWKQPLTGEQKNWVYHAEVYIGEQRLMFSDIINQYELAKGNSLFLAMTFEDAESVMRAYEVLREGSTLLEPVKRTTYSSCIVSLVDRFGVRWALFTEQTEK